MSKMKVVLTICILCAVFGSLRASPFGFFNFGDSKNNKLIDREATYAAADPKGFVTKIFTFPPVSKSIRIQLVFVVCRDLKFYWTLFISARTTESKLQNLRN